MIILTHALSIQSEENEFTINKFQGIRRGNVVVAAFKNDNLSIDKMNNTYWKTAASKFVTINKNFLRLFLGRQLRIKCKKMAKGHYKNPQDV